MSPRAALASTGQRAAMESGGRFDRNRCGPRPGGRHAHLLRGGTPSPILTGPSAFEPLTVASSPPLGVDPRNGLRETTVPLPVGSVACLFTDGLLEARVGDQLFGRERLTAMVGAMDPDEQADDLLEFVIAATDEAADDMAVFVLRPLSGAKVLAPRIETVELDAEDLRLGLGKRFLKACEVPAEDADVALEQARATGRQRRRPDRGDDRRPGCPCERERARLHRSPRSGVARLALAAELGEPVPHGRAHGVEVGAEAVIARDDHNAPVRAALRHAEGVALALHDEHGNLDGVELVLARLLGPAWGVERERQAEHADRTGLRHRPARHPRPGGATADDQRQPAQIAVAQLLDHSNPGRVQLIRRSRRAPSRHQVWLLHEGDAEALAACDLRDRHEVAGRDPPAGSMTEHQRAFRVLGRVKLNPGRAVRRLELEHNGVRG
jgi:Stage II sporulation protein E (SpoIIE)